MSSFRRWTRAVQVTAVMTIVGVAGLASAEPAATRHDFTGLNQKTLKANIDLPNGAGGYTTQSVSFYVAHQTSSDCPKMFVEGGGIARIVGMGLLLNPQISGPVTNYEGCSGATTYTVTGQGLGYIGTSASRNMRIAFEVPTTEGAPLGGYVFDGYLNSFKNRISGVYWAPDKKVRPFVAEEVLNYGDSFGMQARTVRVKAANGKYLSWRDGIVRPDVTTPGATETFTMLDTLGTNGDPNLRSGDYVVFTRRVDNSTRQRLWVYRGPLGGGLVQVSQSSNGSRNYSTNEAFQIRLVSGPNPITGSATVLFRSASGNYITMDGSSLRVDPITAGTNERFILEVVSGPFPFNPTAGTH